MESIKPTPVGTAVFPHLNEPDTKFDKDGVYSVQLRLAKEEAAPIKLMLETKLQDAYTSFCNEKKKKELRMSPHTPWLDDTDQDGNPTGHVRFKFKMRAMTSKGRAMSPLLVDSKGQKMLDHIGGGSRIRISYDPATWYADAQGVGITLRLRGVQVVELMEGGASADAMGFDEVSGGFVSSPDAVVDTVTGDVIADF